VRVLVTGASGFIGAKLCEALLARGDEVVALTRDPERALAGERRVAWHSWEPALERPPGDALEGVEGVVNLVGERIDQRWTAAAKRRIMESRRSGTRNLVEAIAATSSRPGVMVSQSAIGYYGDRGAAALDESAAAGGGFDSEVVREWERAARDVERSGVRLAITRTGHVLDPSGGFLGRLMTPFRLGVGGPVAGGRQYLSWIHIDDEIGLLLWALDEGAVSGAINATAPEPVTSREFASALGRALHRPAVLPVPGLALDLMFGREFGRILRGGQRVVPRRALELGYRFRHHDLDGALADLLSR
jgi:uncharacterized protein (TIGR01777 family)